METLIALQPIALTLLHVGATAGILCSIVWFITTIVSYYHYQRETDIVNIEEEKRADKKFSRTLKWLTILSLSLALISFPSAYSWDIYKNVLAYRAINSPTTNKAIENIDLLMDRLGIVIEEIGNKAPKQLKEGVKEIIEEKEL